MISPAPADSTARIRLQDLLLRTRSGPGRQDADLWAATGEAYLGLGLAREGERAFRAALGLDPDCGAALAGLAGIRLHAGRVVEAEALFGRWFRLAPGEEAIVGIARCRQRNQDDAGALRIIEAFAREQGLTPRLAALFARSATRLGHAEDALAVARLQLADPPLPELLYAMGDALDALGRPDGAFEAWTAANSARRLPWDAAAHSDRVDSLIETWTEEAFARLPTASNADPRPVFIVGVPRSGSSLVEQILSAHSAVEARGELDLVPRLTLHLPRRLGRRAADGDWLSALDPGTLDAVAGVALQELTGPAPEASRVTDKLPHNLFHLGLIALLFPGARVIRCVRDPVDTALSCFRTRLGDAHGWAASVAGVRHFLADADRLGEHWTRALPLPMLDLHYEELVAQPATEIPRLLEFLDLPWQPACLRPEDSERVVATASYAQARQPIHRGSVGRSEPYRRYLTPR